MSDNQEQQFDLKALTDKMPPGLVPMSTDASLTPTTDRDLSPEEKAAIADAEIARREGKKPPTVDNKAGQEGTEREDGQTDEQIQAKLTELEAKEEKDLTPEDREFIEKYTDAEVTAIGSVKNLFTEKYNLDLGETKYEDSPQGVANFIDEVAPVIAEQMLSEHFAQVPAMLDFYKHVLVEGKSVDTFLIKAQKPAFEGIDLKEVSADMPEAASKALINNQKELIRIDLSSKGLDTETIDTLIDLAESSGKLFEKATISKKALQATHTANVAEQLRLEEARIKQDEVAKAETLKAVDNLLKANDFNGKAIPPADLKAFRSALFDVDGHGKTLLEYKRTKLSLADRLYIDYLVLKDLKVSGYVKPQEQAKKFTYQKKNEDNNSRNGGRVRGGGTNQANNAYPQNINLGDFFKNNLNKQQTA